jgi:flagellar biogenesis protein FliO
MDLMRQLGAVALTLGVLTAALWWLRRRGLLGAALPKKSNGRRLQRIERLPLGPHHALDLVRLGERALLVASHPSGCSLIESCSWREMENAREIPR